MDFSELIRKRYSVRRYKETKVEEDKLMKILEAGRIAPTGANRQPQRIIVLQGKEGLEKVNKAARTFGAPLVLVICADRNEAWVRHYDHKNIIDIDASIVTDHMMLQAAELGLGSVWICHFNPGLLAREFKLPENLVPVNILAIGYADDEPASPNRHAELRKSLNETVFFESLK